MDTTANVTATATATTIHPTLFPAVPPLAVATAGPVERLLRDRDGLITDLAAGRRLATTARAMLLTIAIGAALFGAAIGIYRGGVQIAYAAVKRRSPRPR